MQHRKDRTPLHVLLMSSWYRSDYNPGRCEFLHDQALALQSVGITARILFPDLKSPRLGLLSDVRTRRFQPRFATEDRVDTARYMAWSLIPSAMRNGLAKEWQWVWCGHRLASAYARRYGVPDIIHAHTLISAGALAGELSRRWSVPWVFTEHSVEWIEANTPPARARFARQAASSASKAFAVSSALQAGMQRYNLTPERAPEVIPNTIDVSWFTVPPRDRHTPATPYRFVYVGSLNSEVKRTDLLLRAFRLTAARTPDVVLEIVGGGESRGHFEAYAASLGIERHVRWHGFLQREALREVLWNSHALVHPSRRETFGLAVAEALATGLPVIGVASGGVQEIIDAELRGRGCAIVDVDDEQQLAQSMIRLAGEGPSSLELKNLRHQNVSRRFSMRAIGHAYSNAYVDVLAAHALRGPQDSGRLRPP